MAAAEARKSLGNAEKLLTTFEEKARRRGVFYERILDRCLTSDLPDVLVDYARLRDLTIIGAPDPNQGHWFAESIIFGSGRPTLIIPAVGQDKRLFKMEHVVVAWDFSQQAARAVADSMTILEKAKRVSVVTITNEKEIDTKRSGSELAKHLALHGVSVVLEQVDAAGRPIGGVLESYVGATQADLLVMGAYGHSRLREFVLGGATRSMLSNPPLPLLLSR
jgi:nucleotide-binding universal stress UspA family protein